MEALAPLRLVLLATGVALAASATAAPLPEQTNNAGMVTVKVTPLAVSPSVETWRFQVVFDTHSVDLNQDLMAAASLLDAQGREVRPTGWKGDGPGGHHRKAVLEFKRLDPAPPTLALKLKQVGPVPERSFVWPMPR